MGIQDDVSLDGERAVQRRQRAHDAAVARDGRAVGLRDDDRRDVARLRVRRSPDALASSLDANLKVVLARVGRALLILAAVLISLSMVGIDITVLGVFGGALGVGLGFGLQKIASNYVSGFIILLDRSLRLGDMINVSGLQGMVTQIRTRYTVVRGLDGIETLIPNEKLITDVVQNHSSYLTRGYAKVAVQVRYRRDVEQAMTLLVQAAQDVDARAAGPGADALIWRASEPTASISNWVSGSRMRQTARRGVRSAVNRNIWRLFSEHGIAIPFAQREMRIVGNGATLRRDAVTLTAAAANRRRHSGHLRGSAGIRRSDGSAENDAGVVSYF